MLTTTQQPARKLEPTAAEKLERSYNRSIKFTRARVKNLKYYRQMNVYINNLPPLPAGLDEQAYKDRDILHSYRKRLVGCASTCLYRKRVDGRECTLITGNVCNHRLCTICNMIRSRKLRRKWKGFLQGADQDVPLRKAQHRFFELGDLPTRMKMDVDEDTGEVVKAARVWYTSGQEIMQKFDLMHLTLTVPHEGGTWQGLEYYSRQLLQKFNLMRKDRWWLESIFGGEYTVETTANNDGLHIHIHALLFVDKAMYRSRNILSEYITRRWNDLTVDEDSSHPRILDEVRREGLRKSFAFLEENEFNDLMLDLDARGSTMVGLKSLYYQVTDFNKPVPKKSFVQDGKTYAYCTNRNIESILKGVTECLKYHFEPCAVEDENGNLDCELVAKILPNIYRMRLYGKFGGFVGIKQLNVVEEPLTTADMMEDLTDTAGDQAFDPATGTEMQPGEYFYCLADANKVSFDVDKPVSYLSNNSIKVYISPRDAPNLRTALASLMHFGYQKPPSNKEIISVEN